MNYQGIRNIAIIAHVDHGKTTLVDAMLKQSGIFRKNEVIQERVMDSNDLERERGITIFAKNTAVHYHEYKINVVDTPGHADFGGEVERIMKMVDGVLLIVDAYEGPMPQTRFVLRKALEMGLSPLVVVNKIDRPDARVDEVVDEVLDLFIELGASEAQCDFGVVYASARRGIAMKNISDAGENLQVLFDAIIEYIPAPIVDEKAPMQLLVSSLAYDNYIGRICIGKVCKGTIKDGEQVNIIQRSGKIIKAKINKLMVFEGLGRQDVECAIAGEIVAIAGLEDVSIGETICDINCTEALEAIDIDEPTLSMNFIVNTSPFAGKEGSHVTSRKLRERLFKELNTNVSLRVEETDSPDSFKVSGRGELHLSVLIENMRREGYELQVSKPEVIFKNINGIKCEPVESLILDISQDYMGGVMEKIGERKADLQNMTTLNDTQMRLEFLIPSRSLIGFRSEFLTQTRGEGIMSHVFDSYQPYKGDIKTRFRGSLVASEMGEANPYGLNSVEDRGDLLIIPGTRVYEGMIVGECNREQDVEVNVCKKKQLTNVRSSSADDAIRLKEPRILSLEEALEFIENDELVEATPLSIRMRKKYLTRDERVKANKRNISN
ncbi:MAG: translational GTPase TypA [Clostridia bacterium]